jgi:hypothetical protein
MRFANGPIPPILRTRTIQIIAPLNQLSAFPGRKTGLLVSAGFVTARDPGRFQKLMTNANNHGIAFYPLASSEMCAMANTAQAASWP